MAINKVASTRAHLTIGGAASGSSEMECCVKNFAVWEGAATAAEALVLYNKGKDHYFNTAEHDAEATIKKSNLKIYFPLDEGIDSELSSKSHFTEGYQKPHFGQIIGGTPNWEPGYGGLHSDHDHGWKFFLYYHAGSTIQGKTGAQRLCFFQSRATNPDLWVSPPVVEPGAAPPTAAGPPPPAPSSGLGELPPLLP